MCYNYPALDLLVGKKIMHEKINDFTMALLVTGIPPFVLITISLIGRWEGAFVIPGIIAAIWYGIALLFAVAIAIDYKDLRKGAAGMLAGILTSFVGCLLIDKLL